MSVRIGIPLGDATGIGPEVALKAVAAEAQSDGAEFVLIGSEAVIEQTKSQLKLVLPPRVRMLGVGNEQFPSTLPHGAPAVANAALAWLREGAQRCLRGELDALVTAPVNKGAIIRTGNDFIGQTEFLSELAGTTRTAMMLLGHDDRGRWLRVALVTTHLPLRRVADAITQDKVELAIELAARACCDLRLPRRRVVVCGLNPHAGEGGQMGDEEIRIIAPAVERARSRGLDVVGPLAADTVFHHALRGDFDAVVAMYHDQGLAPMKMIGFETGVNWTLGLPFIRTSPDHGTAYDIAGRGVADPSSMIAAVRLAKQLAGNRAATAR
ncbi:MAG: 4-hydroxythreonine-4-phosphate dehydrogenase PdxA [Verrucomicrobia bacterium]|nr:4-hydroxythreonine-4-phosphate dehydrogenase PdxA [Verrucomicrobiota bacterium]